MTSSGAPRSVDTRTHARAKPVAAILLCVKTLRTETHVDFPCKWMNSPRPSLVHHLSVHLLGWLRTCLCLERCRSQLLNSLLSLMGALLLMPHHVVEPPAPTVELVNKSTRQDHAHLHFRCAPLFHSAWKVVHPCMCRRVSPPAKAFP